VAFVTNASGRRNIWTVPAAGGSPTRLTFSEQRQTNLAWSPDGRYIAFVSDEDGNEMGDVFVLEVATLVVTNVTRSPHVDEYDLDWSPDSRNILYAARARSRGNYELQVVDVETFEVRSITTDTPPDVTNYCPRWSPDGTRIAFRRASASGRDSNVCVVAPGGTPVLLTAHDGEANWFVNGWSPDSRRLLVTVSQDGGYKNVALLDVATGALEFLTSDYGDARGRGFTPDGASVLWTRNVDGHLDHVLHDIASKTERVLPLPAGINGIAETRASFTRDGSRLLFLHEGPDSPEDLWVHEVRSGASVQLTHSLHRDVRREDLVHPVLVSYPSNDGRWTIQAWMYVPRDLADGASNPAVVLVHGGPAAQAMNDFDRPVQALVSRGYVVIVPNYRGSTGYGKAFEDANQGDMGGGDLHDVLGAVDFVVNTGQVAPDGVAVMGTSYGAYLTLLAATKAPERIAAAVALFPFVNWFTEVENEDPVLQAYDLAKMGDPVENRALWEDRSPSFFADRLRAPLLLIAGAHDPRCPPSEARQMVAALEKNGQAAELRIYDDEGHGFGRIENQIDAYERIVAFLLQHVPPPAS
jgi:dipeptidyl aminopeptidase/acylaminoacyl peptidase